MPFDYGEIKGTLGVDGKPVNCILIDDLPTTWFSKSVFVATLPKYAGGEDKLMLGFPDRKLAASAFIACYGGDKKLLKDMHRISSRKTKKLLRTHSGRNLRADYDTTQYGLNNYIVEYSPSSSQKEEKDNNFYKKDTDSDKKYAKKLMVRQNKPEVVETALFSNPNDNVYSPGWWASRAKNRKIKN